MASQIGKYVTGNGCTCSHSSDDNCPQGGDGEASSSESEGLSDGSGEEDNRGPDSGSGIQVLSGVVNIHVE